jgi:hypothetical protein
MEVTTTLEITVLFHFLKEFLEYQHELILFIYMFLLK